MFFVSYKISTQNAINLSKLMLFVYMLFVKILNALAHV